jgi:membrane-associated phospholipid phosphatase
MIVKTETKQNVRIAYLTLLLICNILPGKCQIDSLPHNESKKFALKKEILPLGFIVTGSVLNFTNFKYFVRKEIGNTTNIRIDNYIQYAPIGELYIADLTGVKHLNSSWNQTKYLAISELITSAIVQSLKLITKVPRPNGGTLSFPSGHTSNAFASATVLFKEYQDSNLPIALSGYGFSTATGILRMTNNRHWISDVLAGAGIGLLVTHLVYYWEPLKNWNPFKGSKKLSWEPGLNFSGDGVLIGMKIKL